MTDPKGKQEDVVNGTSGIYVVDAGAGTGKTFTITHRYANLLEKERLEPDDILLITFTNNAAAEIKERVVANCDYSMAALRDAPINTFHGFCHQFLLEYGFESPTVLGINDRITSSTRLLENKVVEQDHFREFFTRFVDDHPDHHDQIRLLRDSSSLLGLIKQLAAKGVFPTAEGWFRNGESYLDGDFEAFKDLFDTANEPNEGANGPTQSDLRDRLGRYDRNRNYLSDAPPKSELRSGYPQIDDAWAERAFHEDRSSLKSFVHDVYFEYVEFALQRNYLNFSFLQMFAFALLCENDSLRQSIQFEQVMVDEFQDTSEIQFKLVLLLAGAENICVVGDWKQSIYGFQYASVDNIRQFTKRIQQYKTELNSDGDRVRYPVDDVTKISLRRNYRSTQSILNLSDKSLVLPATQTEEIDHGIKDEITSLESTTDYDHSQIDAITSADEHDEILTRIEHIVDNEEYAVEDEDGNLTRPSYDDIAILTRKRKFGRKLQKRAREFGIPMAYEGGVRLFETDHAILLLAWLRILENEHSRRGWAVVLEEAGYTLDEINHILETEQYPEAMHGFRDRLAQLDTIAGVCRVILARYGFDDAYADTLISVLQGTFEEKTGNRGDVVRFIERSLENGATHDVNDSPGGDSVTIQTIHAAKGLQHPIVIVADINEHSFPASGGSGSRIRYEDPIGLRTTKLYADEDGRPHIYDNWRYRVLSAPLGRDYDEERRLLYVAMTRAESHLLFSAGENPSPFFEELPLTPREVESELTPRTAPDSEQAKLQVTVPMSSSPIGHTPHSLMDDGVFEEVEEGKGMEFGTQVHDFAERYAEGDSVEPQNPDEERVAAFLDRLPGELRPEENAYLPIEVDGHQVTISGIIDLLHLTTEEIDIVDYKTDRGRHAQSEYRKQLTVYYHVVRQLFPERRINTSIFYTADGELVNVDPHTMEDLVELATIEDEGREVEGEDPMTR